jgi:hypothetical protein
MWDGLKTPLRRRLADPLGRDRHLQAPSQVGSMGFDHVAPSKHSLYFLILGQRVRVDCADPALRRLVAVNYGAMAAPDEDVAPDLHYRVTNGGTSPSFSLQRKGQVALDGADPGHLLFLLAEDITVELQKKRADLFFLHSAAIAWQGKACLLAAESGGGKSTTTWGLLHHEFRYLSDELSPIDLDSMRVYPYPRALCLKQSPAPAYPLPGNAVHLGRSIYIPVGSLPRADVSGPRPLGAVFLVRHCPGLSAPNLRPLGPSEASARLYVTALNALAHPNHGLDAVVRISKHVPCFALASADLSATCALIRSTVEQAITGRFEAGKTSNASR